MRNAKGHRPHHHHRGKKRTATHAVPCQMPDCRRLTTRPMGYCDHCWKKGRDAEQ